MAGVQACVLWGAGRKTKGGSRSQTIVAALLLLFFIIIFIFHLFQFLVVTKKVQQPEKETYGEIAA